MSQKIARKLIDIANPIQRLGLIEDEFCINIHGHKICAFKDFALPCIHLIEGKSRTDWKNQSEMALYRSMERARLFCQQADFELWRWIKLNPIPKSASAAGQFTELVKRLRLAFKLQAPFYDLEREVELCEKATGGDLELALMMLPSAFRVEVVAHERKWEDSWPALKKRTKHALTDGLKRRILLRLAALSEVSPEHIVFVANALEFIPGRPGGKAKDAPQRDALAAMSELSVKPKGLGDLNAKIRFENFLPLMERVENFFGKSWRYASVCETSDELLHLVVEHPELWKKEFREEFSSEILPQLGFMDATSPKGRILLDFIEQGKSCIFAAKDKRWERNVVATFKFPRIQGVGIVRPRSEIGEKGFGLAIANVAGYLIIPGKIITAPAIRDYRKIDLRNLSRKQRWAVRSSALDEGIARGVYNSCLNVGYAGLRRAIKKTANSFFTPKAKNFRKVNGIGEEIDLAVILQKYRRLKGGVIHNGVVYHGSTAAQVTSGKASFEASGSHDLLSIFPNGQIEFQDSGVNRTILQLEFGESENVPISFDLAKKHKNAWIKSSQELLVLLPKKDTSFILHIKNNLVGFDGVLMAWIACHGPRIAEIRHPNPPGGGSHLANLCRYFGIKLKHA